eukprot:GDKK01019102.1.p1 GENE.GDKK01019102.1~~GDKK01019102.1.p1  ORF type:complete len:217 (-),score=30.07 GDKK01019102.1:47-667(-)
MAEPPYDHMIKVLLIGEASVGKSSILLRFTNDEFDQRQLATIGVDYRVKYMEPRVKLALWDTAGQEKFRTLTGSYYRGAHGIVLVYDCTVRASFERLPTWLDEIAKNVSNPDAVKVLVANKIDKDNHEVTREEGEAFAIQHSMMFIETSAKTAAGVQQTFEELVMKILESPSLRTSGPRAAATGVSLNSNNSSINSLSGNTGSCAC